MKRYWLRREGTDMVCQRTQALADNPKMVPCTEEEARGCQKRHEDSTRNAALLRAAGQVSTVAEEAEAKRHAEMIAQGLIPPDAQLPSSQPIKGTAPTLDQMNVEELRAVAKAGKILIPDGATADEIRKEILSAASAQVPQQPAAPAEEPDLEFAPENDDLVGLDRQGLFAKADEVGVVKSGTNTELAYKIRQARKAKEEEAKG